MKLLDYQQHWAMLEASDNPFATVIIMAHLIASAIKYNAFALTLNPSP
ncbi:MAG: hypothetical protein MUF49_24710 [Oculatellaceae cyanobacterium Prado106]|nr:hypothetical protein [Oculatellaceae cyanobacterium Prado106]